MTIRVSAAVRAPKSTSVPSGCKVAAMGSPGVRPRITKGAHRSMVAGSSLNRIPLNIGSAARVS
ncbi:Uncharacterised protein [Mycobacteroides abscessus subsp. abscessus]|nr:Uncharacterised protein [Mycobacteroides abscessus subsp. abscessus]